VGEGRKVSRDLVGKPEGKRPFERPRRRRDDRIRTDLREIGWGSEEWIPLAQDWECWWALVNAVMNLNNSFKIISAFKHLKYFGNCS
jgi:hypothetical protein